MTFEARKLQLIEWLLSLDDENLLSQVENLKNQSDIWDELNEAQKAEIQEGIDELEQGYGAEFKEIIAPYKQ